MNLKVVEHTPIRFVFRTRLPVWVMVVVWAFVAAVIVFSGLTVVFRCSRSAAGQVICQVQHQLLGVALSSRTVDGVEGAHLEIIESRDSRLGRNRVSHRQPMARIVLDTTRGIVPSSRSYDSEIEPKERAVAELTAFLRTPTRLKATVAVAELRGWRILLVGLLIAACGVTWASWTACSLDKEQDLISVWGPGSGGFKSQRLPLSEVVQFTTQVQPASRRGSSAATFLAARLADGQEVRLMPNMPNGLSSVNLVRQLEAFRRISNPAPTEGSGEDIVKPCAICGKECANVPRLKDELGRYYHPECHHP